MERSKCNSLLASGYILVQLDEIHDSLFQISLGSPDDGTRYYWRMRGVNSAGMSGYSEARTFVNAPIVSGDFDLDGDFDGDNDVDQNDLNLFASHFGM